MTHQTPECRPSAYALPGLAHTILTIPVNPATGEVLALFADNPTAYRTGCDEANAVFALLKTLLPETLEAKDSTPLSPQPERTSSCLPGRADAPSPAPTGTHNTNFLWRPEMVESLRSTVQLLRAQNPAASITAMSRQIAQQHGWPLKAIGYKIYALGLNKVAATQQARHQHEAIAPSAARTGEAITLPGGNIAWAVQIDGLPFTWQLDVLHGHFPYTAPCLLTHQGQRYRLQRVQASALHLVTEEADIYDLPQFQP